MRLDQTPHSPHVPQAERPTYADVAAGRARATDHEAAPRLETDNTSQVFAEAQGMALSRARVTPQAMRQDPVIEINSLYQSLSLELKEYVYSLGRGDTQDPPLESFQSNRLLLAVLGIKIGDNTGQQPSSRADMDREAWANAVADLANNTAGLEADEEQAVSGDFVKAFWSFKDVLITAPPDIPDRGRSDFAGEA